MTTFRLSGLSVALAAALTVTGASRPATAQEFGETVAAPAAPASGDAWYRTPAAKTSAPSLARERAIQRGQQRMARLEALRWYGFSNSRPTAATLPFTTMYSPAWQMPGGRPFAWYSTNRPVVILGGAPTIVR